MVLAFNLFIVHEGCFVVYCVLHISHVIHVLTYLNSLLKPCLELQSERGNNNQVRKLLDTLCRGNEDTLDKFIYALRESSHSELGSGCLREPHKPDSWSENVTREIGELN